MSSQEDISDASADIAVTKGPRERPPRKKSPAVAFLSDTLNPMKSMPTRYRTMATIIPICATVIFLTSL